jgi:hypothetical protein
MARADFMLIELSAVGREKRRSRATQCNCYHAWRVPLLLYLSLSAAVQDGVRPNRV